MVIVCDIERTAVGTRSDHLALTTRSSINTAVTRWGSGAGVCVCGGGGGGGDGGDAAGGRELGARSNFLRSLATLL